MVAVSVMRTARSFFSMMGMNYVAGSPVPRAELLVPAIAGSIAVRVYIAYREWHG